MHARLIGLWGGGQDGGDPDGGGSGKTRSKSGEPPNQEVEAGCDPPDADVAEYEQRVSNPQQKEIVNREVECGLRHFLAASVKERNTHHAAGDAKLEDETIPIDRKPKHTEPVQQHGDDVPGQRQKNPEPEEILVSQAETKEPACF